MEKHKLILDLIEDLLSLSDEKYQEAKDYWKDNPPESENLITFVQILFLYADIKRKVGATNADAK